MRFLYVLVIVILITGCKNPLGANGKADSGFLPGLGSIQPATEATKLEIVTEPQDAVAGQSLGSIQIRLLDDSNTPITTDGFTISVAIQSNPGSSTIMGTASQLTVNGVATFSNLALNKVGTSYSLIFSGGSLTPATSQNFDISVGALSSSTSTLTVSPTSLVANDTSTSTITATLKDAYSNPIIGETVTFASTGTYNTIVQPAGTTNSSGVATGTIRSSQSEVKVISFSAPAGLSSLSANLTFTAYVSQMAITTQPADAVAGQSLGSVQVQLRDLNNNAVSTSGVSITAAIQNNPGTSTLSGTTTRTTNSSGVATFSNLSLDKIGTGYTLVFTSTGLSSENSQTFNITPAAISAAQSTLVLNPTTLVADNTSTSTITLTLRDAYNNPISGQSVVFAATGTGNTIVQPSSTTNTSGVATGTIRSSVPGTKAVSVTTPTGLSALTTNIVFGVNSFTETFAYNNSNTNYTVSTSTLAYTSSTLAHKSLTVDASNSSSEFAGAVSNTNVEWNGSNAMRLSATGLTARTGNFESRIMSAPATTNWTSFEWQSLSPAGKKYPSNRGVETGYSSDGIDMSGNVLLMHFDETSWSSSAGQVVDSSGTGNNGTIVSTPTPGTNSKFGRALTMGSTGQYITVPHSNTLDSSAEMSWEAWIYPTNVDGNPRPIMAKRQGTGANYGYTMFIFAGARMNIDIAGSGSQRFDTGIVFSANTWYHVAATFNGSLASNRLKFYVNGVLSSQHQPTATAIPATDANAIFSIGSMAGSSFTFLGSIDEVAIYERVLSPTEIAARFNRGSRKIKFQARGCAMSNCADGTYVGPDGTAATFFTEEQNTGLTNTTSVTLPSAFNNKQYFQYHATLESSNGTINPGLQNAGVKPDIYDSGYPTVTNIATFSFLTLTSFTATESGTVRYQISHDGTNWYYYNSGWVAATLGYTHTNTKNDINTNISTFPTTIGTGNFYVRAFYDAGTNSTTPASLTSISVQGGR